MSARSIRRITRKPAATSLPASTPGHQAALPRQPASGNGLDAETPNPLFADAARRRALVEKAAYSRAEQRGFEPGHALEDWFEAEREIDARLFRGEIPTS